MTDVITTERLVLRPLTDADGETVITALNDFDVVKWLATPPYPFTKADLRLKNQDGSSRWPELAAIETGGQMVGIVSGQPHLGYWVQRDHWGQGIATEAAGAMTRHIFATSNVTSVLSGYFVGNTASAKILQKLGFTETGRGMRQCVSRGEDLPHVDLVLHRARWEADQ